MDTSFDVLQILLIEKCSNGISMCPSTIDGNIFVTIAYFKFAKEVRELNRELAGKRKGQ